MINKHAISAARCGHTLEKRVHALTDRLASATSLYACEGIKSLVSFVSTKYSVSAELLPKGRSFHVLYERLEAVSLISIRLQQLSYIQSKIRTVT